MSTNRKASIAKRARELAQKDRVKDREQRRAERKVRQQERVASGIVGPEMGEAPTASDSDSDDDVASLQPVGTITALPRPGT